MEIVTRRHTVTTTNEIETNDHSEVIVTGVSGALASALALALAGGTVLSAYDLSMLTYKLASHPVDISASATTSSPVRRRYDVDGLAARARELATVSLQAAAEQLEFQWQEVTGEDILAYVTERGGTALVERDTVSGVIDSITASFYDYDPNVVESILAAATPKKIVGDLAQTSIVTATGEEQIIGLSEWTISWKRKTVESTTTDDALYEGALGSTKSWTVKSKFMFVDGDPSQVDGVLSAIDTTALDALTWNFFPTVEIGRAAFQGLAFIDGIDIGSGSGKIVGLDVSLKGTGPLKRLVQIAPVANTTTVTGQQAEV